MIKNLLFAMALLSLALAGGCAKGGNGAGSGITVKVSDGSIAAVYPSQHVTFTAAVTGTTNTAVTWSLSGSGCTGTGNPCGTIDKNSGVYVAPAAPPSPATVTITATSAADSTATGESTVTVVLVTAVVTPCGSECPGLTLDVGQGLVQQFTAIAVPDDAPQTFTWTCTPAGSCGNIVQDPNTSGLAVYTAPASNGSVTVAATSTVAQTNPAVGTSKVAVITSRLPSGGYSFRFSGDDNSGNHVAKAGSLTVAANGSITGIEDVLSASGPQQLTVNSGSYAPSSNNNNLGTLTLNLSNGDTNKYTAVVASSGVIRMVEADSTGTTGSGVMQKSAPQQFDAGAQTFAFGFTGVDSSGKRVGFVGLLPMDGSGTIASGMLDSNDNGDNTNVCGAEPCSVTGSYQQDPLNLGLWHMTLTSGITQHFDFVIGGGVTQTKTAVNPLTLYAISTDGVDATHPALSGNMVYQVPMTYNNAAFSGSSVSNLTGANANVALTVGITDGTSGGTGGTGGFTGTFDQNNDGAIISVVAAKPFSYTYVAASGSNGRYTFQMLGNPNANPVVSPLPFVLYASGANRGFLLDQSSTAVMTGSMEPQLTPNGFNYVPSELPGTYAAATIGNSDSGIMPLAENLLLTSTGMATYNVAGTENPGSITLTGSYTLTNNSSGAGTGTITLTAPAGQTYVIYAIDATAIPMSTNAVIDDFMMMETDKASSIIFAQQ